MRHGGALLVLCACGRIGFEPAEPAHGDGGADDDGAQQLDDGAGANDVRFQLSAAGACPAVAVGDGRVGAAWREGGMTGSAVIVFAALDDTGIVQGPLSVRAVNNADCPAIAWSGTAFLVAYAHGTLNNHDIDVTPVSAAGPLTTSNVVMGASDSTKPQLAGNGSTWLLAWHSQSGSNYAPFVRALDANGAPRSDAFQITGATPSHGAPRVTATPTGFAVMWSSGTRTHLQVFDGGGAPAGGEILHDSTASGPVPVAAVGNELLAAWSAFAGDSIFVARYDSNGPIGTPMTHAEAAPDDKAMAAIDGGAALLFSETSGLVQFHLVYLDASGAITGRQPLDNASTDSRASLARWGSRLVAGLDTNNGAFVRVIVP